MSKKNVLSFLSKAAMNQRLKEQLNMASTQDELVEIGKVSGYDFSVEHLEEAMDELKQKSGFWGSLAAAVVELFSPDHDNYPETGVQPYSGDPSSKS